jgi:ABC-type Zn uptake system ZnuABC Zn-binding protein ZnuA
MRRFSLLVALLVTASLASCRPAVGPAGEKRPAVAASVFPLYDLVRRVAGAGTPVGLVLPPGHLDHTFDPRPRELSHLSDVELAFGVGLGLDPWLGRVLDTATDGRARVMELAPALDPRPIPSHLLELAPGEGGARGPLDPHVVLDPVRMSRATSLVAAALASRDPAGAEGYRERASKVAYELRALDEELRERSRRWTRRTIVIFHGSFLYFADRYGLEVAAVVEPLPGREPTPRHVARVLEAIRATRAAALFSEPQLDPQPARVIAEESGLPLFVLDPVGGGPDTPTYEALHRKNVAVLDEALR